MENRPLSAKRLLIMWLIVVLLLGVLGVAAKVYLEYKGIDYKDNSDNLPVGYKLLVIMLLLGCSFPTVFAIRKKAKKENNRWILYISYLILFHHYFCLIGIILGKHIFGG